jgi:molybdenum transport protein
MLYFTDKEIDDLLIEDVPYFDLTTSLLRLENKPAKIQFATRETTVVCCTEEVLKIFSKSAIQPTLFTPSGEQLEDGVKFLEGEGLARNIHAVLRASENLLGFASGIATRTRQLIEKSQLVNQDVIIATNRKVIPFTKKISIKAVKAGGAAIHRLGLSETILIFENHYSFLGGLANLEKRISEQKGLISGKVIAVEVKKAEDALLVAKTGIDLIQLEGFNLEDIRSIKDEIRKLNTRVKIAVAGSITLDNVEEYASSGADILVTSWPYYGKPSDLVVNIVPILDRY